MSDGFAIDLLSWQLHQQHMDVLDRQDFAYANLIAQNQQLVADYNKLAARYNALDQSARQARAEADAKIAELERHLSNAEASAAHWRFEYAQLFKSTLPK